VDAAWHMMAAMISILESENLASELIPVALTVLVVAMVVGAGNLMLLKGARSRSGAARIVRQLSFFAICCIGAVTIVLSLPLEENLRGQMLSLFGLVFTAVVGLGSTTLFSNAMAGFMLRSTRGFRAGDFIEVEGKLGRVTERGLFHTEIQTEARDLCTFPNAYLASRPVQVIRASGTMVMGEVSLGYDVPQDLVKKLLVRAAEVAGLSDPIVRVRLLGDFSITYRVWGFLEEVKHLLGARSKLNSAVLDALHEGGVEIVSPSFMNQRALDPAQPVIPHPSPRRFESDPPGSDEETEAIIFDKADQAGRIEELRQTRNKLLEEAEHADAAAGEAQGREAEDLEKQAQGLRAHAAAIEEELATEAEAERHRKD
jgi:small conductance mechanosensitive channel